MNNINISEGHLDIINDNDNISKTNDFNEFFIYVGGFISLLFIIFLIFNFSANIYIQNLSPSQQVNLEKIIAQKSKLKLSTYTDSKYTSKINYLEQIKKRIISNDKNLQNRSNLNLHIIPNREINAFVSVDGNLYFTTSLLDKISDKEQLAFVLAHELGHYSHRDNLKAFSRELSLIAIASLVSILQNDSTRKTTSGLMNITNIKYSKSQELNADLYANNAIKKFYGTNKPAIKFFNTIEKEDKNPDFIYMFANHPHPKERIKALQNK